MKTEANPVFIRYWVSFFKSARHAGVLIKEFRPMIERGWSCYLVVERPPEEGAWVGELLQMGVKLVCNPRPRGNFDLKSVFRVWSLARRLGATVFQVENRPTSPLIGAWLAGVPVRFWWKRSMNPDFEQCRPPTLKERVAISLRIACALCTRVIAVSNAVKEQLVGMGVGKDKILVRTNARRLGSLNPSLDRQAMRQSWDCSAQNVVLITVGHAVPVKGWDVLLLAFARVVQAAPHARLVLVGGYSAKFEQPFYNSLLEMIERHQLREKVTFTGHIFDIVPLLPSADVFVLPSRSEGCCSALNEALEAGLPCVATRVGHAAEVVPPGVNGFLVDRCDPQGLCEALLQLVENETLRTRFAKRAVLPPGVPTLEQYAEQIARDYESCLPGGPAQPSVRFQE
jgi:glycosyltransferase involved in cell wall biosynthesis